MGYFYDVPPETFDGIFDEMKNEYVSPAVAYLAHESCSLNGETLISGGLGVMRLAMIQTKGFHATGTITPEDVAANLDAIMDTTDADQGFGESSPSTRRGERLGRARLILGSDQSRASSVSLPFDHTVRTSSRPMLTVQYAKHCPLSINAVEPGFTATDLTPFSGAGQPVEWG